MEERLSTDYFSVQSKIRSEEDARRTYGKLQMDESSSSNEGKSNMTDEIRDKLILWWWAFQSHPEIGRVEREDLRQLFLILHLRVIESVVYVLDIISCKLFFFHTFAMSDSIFLSQQCVDKLRLRQYLICEKKSILTSWQTLSLPYNTMRKIKYIERNDFIFVELGDDFDQRDSYDISSFFLIKKVIWLSLWNILRSYVNSFVMISLYLYTRV